MKQRHRIFIDINLPGDVKQYLSGFRKKWPDLPAKWVSEDNLHITLVFLGDLTDQELGEVCMTVKEAAKNHNAFDINLNNIKYGPDNKLPPRMVWASGEKNKELSLLKKYLENALLEKVHPVKYRLPQLNSAKGGPASLDLTGRAVISPKAKLFNRVNFRPEERSFSPHVTLARISTFLWRQIDPEERPEIQENIDLNFTVEFIEVMESELKREGPYYTIIESYQLQ